MDVSPQSIRQVEFREKLRGYHQDDVDEFLERVAAAFEIMQDRLRQATDRAVRAESAAGEAREDDDALRRTLVLAQRTADLAVQEAREQAARIVESAEAEAAAMRADAEEDARRLVEDSQAQTRAEVAHLEATRRELDEDVDRLMRYVEDHRARAKAVLADAAANLDAALKLPPRPMLRESGLGGPQPSTTPGYDLDEEPVAGGSSYDRDLLAEVIERGRDDRDASGGFWRHRS